jgi:hypothetical protein
MVAAETMEGVNVNKTYALTHKTVVDLLRNYKRKIDWMTEPQPWLLSFKTIYSQN